MEHSVIVFCYSKYLKIFKIIQNILQFLPLVGNFFFNFLFYYTDVFFFLPCKSFYENKIHQSFLFARNFSMLLGYREIHSCFLLVIIWFYFLLSYFWSFLNFPGLLCAFFFFYMTNQLAILTLLIKKYIFFTLISDAAVIIYWIFICGWSSSYFFYPVHCRHV